VSSLVACGFFAYIGGYLAIQNAGKVARRRTGRTLAALWLLYACAMLLVCIWLCVYFVAHPDAISQLTAWQAVALWIMIVAAVLDLLLKSRTAARTVASRLRGRA
jgi:cytochrome bd-type quinol oxidase subunit 2